MVGDQDVRAAVPEPGPEDLDARVVGGRAGGRLDGAISSAGSDGHGGILGCE
jgi:hypothetical protein